MHFTRHELAHRDLIQAIILKYQQWQGSQKNLAVVLKLHRIFTNKQAAGNRPTPPHYRS